MLRPEAYESRLCTLKSHWWSSCEGDSADRNFECLWERTYYDKSAVFESTMVLLLWPTKESVWIWILWWQYLWRSDSGVQNSDRATEAVLWWIQQRPDLDRDSSYDEKHSASPSTSSCQPLCCWIGLRRSVWLHV